MALLFLTAIDEPFVALDDAGQPLPLAELTFFTRGTTTPDALGTEIADENGGFAVIETDAALEYRVRLVDADGNVRFDVDRYQIDTSVAGRNFFRSPVVQAIDDDGRIVPGATMTFYAAGTSNKQDIYADAELTVKHPNPITASAAGLFPPIYLSGDYKVESSFADTVDPYPPPAPEVLFTIEVTVGELTPQFWGWFGAPDNVGAVSPDPAELPPGGQVLNDIYVQNHDPELSSFWISWTFPESPNMPENILEIHVERTDGSFQVFDAQAGTAIFSQRQWTDADPGLWDADDDGLVREVRFVGFPP